MAAISVRRHGLLTIRTREDRGSLVLLAEGELDIASAPGLEHSLLHALDSTAASIVLDLTAVSFIDCAGIRVLMWAAGRSREDGDRLRIDCGSPAVRQLIDLTGSGRELPLPSGSTQASLRPRSRPPAPPIDGYSVPADAHSRAGYGSEP